MATNLQAYEDYLVKEKNYSPLTVRAYLDDINSFQDYLNQHLGSHFAQKNTPVAQSTQKTDTKKEATLLPVQVQPDSPKRQSQTASQHSNESLLSPFMKATLLGLGAAATAWLLGMSLLTSMMVLAGTFVVSVYYDYRNQQPTLATLKQPSPQNESLSSKNEVDSRASNRWQPSFDLSLNPPSRSSLQQEGNRQRTHRLQGPG